MYLMQISSGQGPIESCRAVMLAMQSVLKEGQNLNLKITELERKQADQKGCARSVLLLVEGSNSEALLRNWLGTLQWRCTSPYRPSHKRKNWFFDCCIFHVEQDDTDHKKWLNQLEYQSCRASGAGGQHINTTDSAVQAHDPDSKLTVKVSTERSQHANKRLAQILLWQKRMELLEQKQQSAAEKRWRQHWQLERGNASHLFVGENFKRVI